MKETYRAAVCLIEPIESRIAPASLVLLDLDGDKVTFTASADALDGLVTKTNARGDLHSVFAIDISASLLTAPILPSRWRRARVATDSPSWAKSTQG